MLLWKDSSSKWPVSLGQNVMCSLITLNVWHLTSDSFTPSFFKEEYINFKKLWSHYSQSFTSLNWRSVCLLPYGSSMVCWPVCLADWSSMCEIVIWEEWVERPKLYVYLAGLLTYALLSQPLRVTWFIQIWGCLHFTVSLLGKDFWRSTCCHIKLQLN